MNLSKVLKVAIAWGVNVFGAGYIITIAVNSDISRLGLVWVGIGLGAVSVSMWMIYLDHLKAKPLVLTQYIPNGPYAPGFVSFHRDSETGEAYLTHTWQGRRVSQEEYEQLMNDWVKS